MKLDKCVNCLPGSSCSGDCDACECDGPTAPRGERGRFPGVWKLTAIRACWSDRLFLWALALTFSVDQVAKYIVRSNLEVGQSVELEGPFHVTYLSNDGAASGILGGQNLSMALLSILAIFALVNFCRRKPVSRSLLPIGIGLELGGALGNLTDRLTQGHVVDFLDLGNLVVFNLADLSILAGFLVLIWVFVSSRRPTQAVKPT